MKRTVNGEYKAGLASGKLHLHDDFLCRENIRKAKTGSLCDDEPLVKAYWSGYLAGLTTIGIAA